MSDGLRFVTVLVALIAASQLPGILTARVPGWRSWVIVAAFEVLLLSRVGATIARLGEKLHWYGTPSTLLASCLILVYVFSALPQRPRRTRV